MSPMPCPTELELPIRNEHDVDAHRNLYCKQYDRCLDFSVQRGWASFSCHTCVFFPCQENAPQVRDFAERRNREQAGP